jgi:glycine hydroxymethyltransferase
MALLEILERLNTDANSYLIIYVAGYQMTYNFMKILDYMKAHDQWMDTTINLIASENKLSPYVKQSLGSDFGNRVAEGWLGERVFPGLHFYDKIEGYGIELIQQMFGADFVDPRPISGVLANMVVYSAFTTTGDTIIAPSIPNGGHISMSGATPKIIFKLNVINYPFSLDDFNIDTNKSVEMIEEISPKLVVLGGSVLLFKQPIKELAKAARAVGALVFFDASHVAGLIAAGLFPNPLDEGADIMTLTTSKTIPGPQHAFILAKNRFAEKIKKTTFPALLSGHHLHETVASILTMEEFKVFGKAYMVQILKNAKVLACELSSSGFDVLAPHKGFTETHMFLSRISKNMNIIEAERLLESANIIVNRSMLPCDRNFASPSGFRFGTQEVTRIGMKEDDMVKIARFIRKVLIDKVEPNFVKKEVMHFRKTFDKIHYCFENLG